MEPAPGFSLLAQQSISGGFFHSPCNKKLVWKYDVEQDVESKSLKVQSKKATL